MLDDATLVAGSIFIMRGDAQARRTLVTVAVVVRALLARCEATQELLHRARVVTLLEAVDPCARHALP